MLFKYLFNTFKIQKIVLECFKKIYLFLITVIILRIQSNTEKNNKRYKISIIHTNVSIFDT
jgi:hypothetical protein